MREMDDLIAWTTLTRTPGLDAATLRAAFDLLGGPAHDPVRIRSDSGLLS